MAGRRLLQVVALVGLLGSMGCQAWCNRWYPQQACCAPPACCCTPCAPVAGYQAPAPAPATAWNQPCPAGCTAR
jgi:hypothetical protein